ncbi:MAG: hypothetical protein AAGD13_12180 [Pseudomonadota bacterium]
MRRIGFPKSQKDFSSRRSRALNNGILLCVLILPGVFFYFGLTMAHWRYEQRALAERITGEVVEVLQKTFDCKTSNGDRTTCVEYAFTVAFESGAGRIQRPLLEVNFDENGGRFSSDEVDPEIYSVGQPIPLLLRPELGNAVAPDLFWAAYLIPTVLLGFGTFMLIMISIAILMFWQR